MAVISAKALKALETPEFTLDMGGGKEIQLRRPDFQLLLLKGLIPTPLLGEVVKLVGQWAGADMHTLTEDIIASSEKLLLFVNTYVCTAMVSPRCVMTADEQTALGGDALLPDDLTLTTRKMIVRKCAEPQTQATREVVADATEFPQVGSGEGTRPDVLPVSAAAV